MMDKNPLVWMAEVNGYLVDLRHMPREVQEIAFEKGMIPYIPADRNDRFGRPAMLSVLRLAQPRLSDHIISMPANTETQFTLFDRPSSPDGRQAPRQKRRAHLPDLVQGVGQLENDELVDLIRVAIGEARRRGIGSVPAASDSSQGMAPVVEADDPGSSKDHS